MIYVIVVCVAVIIASYSILPTLLAKRFRKRYAPYFNEKKTLYLTFDDGPSKEYTQRLLELLRKYNIHATFFVVAQFAESCPESIDQMKQDGHLIGIHSYGHQNALFRGGRFMYSDFATSIFTLEKLGCNVQYYRPPWGHLNVFTLYWLKRLGLTLVLWDVMAQDWEKGATVETITRKILTRVKPGSVICLHDGRGAPGAPGRTIEALQVALPMLVSQGYTFQRLDESYGAKV